VDKDRALARLIVEAKSRSNSNYREMERRAREAGEPISSALLNNYGTSSAAKAPGLQQVRAIAAATGRTVTEVMSAMLEEFYGLTATDLASAATEGAARSLMPTGLTSEEETGLKKLIQAWLATR
jgi:hypothetical protein